MGATKKAQMEAAERECMACGSDQGKPKDCAECDDSVVYCEKCIADGVVVVCQPCDFRSDFL